MTTAIKPPDRIWRIRVCIPTTHIQACSCRRRLFVYFGDWQHIYVERVRVPVVVATHADAALSTHARAGPGAPTDSDGCQKSRSLSFRSLTLASVALARPLRAWCVPPPACMASFSFSRSTPYKRARISLRALHLPPACPPTTVVRTSRACMHDDGSICMRTRLVTKVNSLLLSPRTSLTVTGNNAR
jgi:hypothetical protein